MVRVRRILGRVSAVLLVASALIGAAGYRGLQASRAVREGTLTLAGLEAPVEIRFDSRARPYVQAATLGDAFFTQGFLHASERLWQMELLTRAGRGRLAEVLGRALLETDRELWRTGVPQLAARLEASADPATRERVARYVGGVNAALDGLAARPPELLLLRIPLGRWTPAHVYALGAAMAFSSARNESSELLRWAISQTVSPEELAAFLPHEASIPDFPYLVSREEVVAILARRDALDAAEQPLLPSLSLGSNGWAVAPRASRSGRALFAFDSHDALALPNLHYEVHLFFGDRSIRGWSVPGMPGVINGFNQRMAWGFTNIGDSQDLFLETRDAEDPERFLGPDGWYRARTENVEIPVRGAESEKLRILHTRHGPLLHDDPPLALAWTAHHSGALGLDALFDLNLATDWASTSAALDRLAAPSANVTYADVEGHVAFRTVGLLPIRGRGEGLLPLPGAAADVAWRGMLPMSELPRRVDPFEGFVAAANARVNPCGSGPLISADNAPGYRIGRIQQVLAGSARHSPADMRALQMDWRNGHADRVLAALLAELGDAPLGGAPHAARALLEIWESEPLSRPGAPEPLLFQRWYLALAEAIFAERLGPELWPRFLRNNYLVNQALDGLILAKVADSPWWRGDRSTLVRRAFQRAVRSLEAELGGVPSSWRWDTLHRVHLTHELSTALPLLGRWLDRGPHPWGGDHATVGRARYRYDRPERVTTAATVRVVIEMTDPMNVWAILPGGQAGHPFDPHFADQLEPWLRGEHDVLSRRFGEATGRVLHLEPAGSR
jgi:penicillin amidase